MVTTNKYIVLRSNVFFSRSLELVNIRHFVSFVQIDTVGILNLRTCNWLKFLASCFLLFICMLDSRKCKIKSNQLLATSHSGLCIQYTQLWTMYLLIL